MANPEHLAKLREGVEAWNEWRREHREQRPDLSGARLDRMNLSGDNIVWAGIHAGLRHGTDLSATYLYSTDLSGADLRECDLSAAILVGANLSKADLSTARLAGVNLLDADLSDAKLVGANLDGAKMNRTKFKGTDLSYANLSEASLKGADLSQSRLRGAVLRETDLSEANLSDADLGSAQLLQANLIKAKLRGAYLFKACLLWTNLFKADLTNANLVEANLGSANLNGAILRGSNLARANLSYARIVGADVEDAFLSGCSIYGCSVWNLRGTPKGQFDVVITPQDEPEITVDNIEVAQFLFLLLNNQKIRDVIDTITSKVVLILGRFTADRKLVLDAIRDELRKRDYLPVLFDFDKPANRDITETVSTLAHMARFIVADLTDAKSIPQELGRIVPFLPSVPVQPILLASQTEWGMFETFPRYPWVLPIARYDNQRELLAKLEEEVIEPAERKATEQITLRQDAAGERNRA
jgi:uncharacterized protein YjbI with pentapeptide repeats